MDLPSKEQGMDVTALKNAVEQQLSGSGLYSLQLQNHIYGCFIIMEDIAQKTVELSDNKLYCDSDMMYFILTINSN